MQADSQRYQDYLTTGSRDEPASSSGAPGDGASRGAASSSRFSFFSLPKLYADRPVLRKLPFGLKILLENVLRSHANSLSPEPSGSSFLDSTARLFEAWVEGGGVSAEPAELAFRPTRVLMQDFTGVPALVDLAAMREALKRLGGDPTRIDPACPVDLVIDHSISVDRAGSPEAFEANVAREFTRNQERYGFLRWGSRVFKNLRVVPPGRGICHQINVEYLAQLVWTKDATAYFDSVVGTDSHTTMINGLGVLGWGVGGIEAEAAMLGQPVSMSLPEVVGFELTGALSEGVTATDLVLRVVQMLRQKGVVGQFVEFYGDGLKGLSVADRCTIANMAPEYGATCGLFPIDDQTLHFLRLTSRSPQTVQLVEAYCRAQGLWGWEGRDLVYTSHLNLDLAEVEPALAGPSRPNECVTLKTVPQSFEALRPSRADGQGGVHGPVPPGSSSGLTHGSVVIAAITSCTNTSNPAVMLAAGLVARRARERGLRVPSWVKTSLAPGSQVVTDYLTRSGLQADLDALGFQLVGYGCTTCIGNSGPLAPEVERAIESQGLYVCAVLSGNRNFEGRVHPLTRANYLASPPLVVAYGLAGTVCSDLTRAALGLDEHGKPVYLRDIWPTSAEIARVQNEVLSPQLYQVRYQDIFEGSSAWGSIEVPPEHVYRWPDASTYIRRPPYFEAIESEPPPLEDIRGARLLGIFGDSLTTDHISPAGTFRSDTPAGRWLVERQVPETAFNSYGARRGNHEVMLRGTFGNIRIRNEMLDHQEGGLTRHYPSGEVLSIFEASARYREANVPLVVVGGREYGTGSSRDWAAKGTRLLGVRAVLAESFERIHRSNLIGMGVLPLQLPEGVTRRTLGLTGDEIFDITGLDDRARPGQSLVCTITRASGAQQTFQCLSRIDTETEALYYDHGGVLHYVLRKTAQASSPASAPAPAGT